MNTKRITKAVIFDMDGVISDTQVIHAKVASEILKNHGIDMSPEKITARFAGVGSREMFKQLFEEFGKEMPELDVLVKEKLARMNTLIEGDIKEIPGTKEFIERLKSRNFPLAVASASRLQLIELVLSKLSLRDKFDAIASTKEVEKGKPEPDVFLLAAQRLGVLPEQCLVIEDGLSGMVAAKRAGMKCIGLVRDGINQDYPADLLVKDLREVSIEQL